MASTNAAIERHCDLMRQGFMKMSKVPPLTTQQIKDAKERAAVILAKLDRTAAQAEDRWNDRKADADGKH